MENDMKLFGEKNKFAMEYEMTDSAAGLFELWVGGLPVCCKKENDSIIPYEWRLDALAQWLEDNLQGLICEEDFPLPVSAEGSLDFYAKSGEFDSDSLDEIEAWFGKRQDWLWRHSWYIAREGSYLAEVFFRRVGENIEVEWDNSNLYDGIVFANPKGKYLVDAGFFEQTVKAFLSDFSQYDQGKVYGAILENGEPTYTRFRRIFRAMGDFQLDYNWLITDCEAFPKRHGHSIRIHQSKLGDYAWISGEELTDILRRDDFQWAWGVLSGFNKDIPKEEILRFPLPCADGNPDFWRTKLTIQHPLAEAELVAWDSALTLVFSRDEQKIKAFREAFPQSEDLKEHNMKIYGEKHEY